VVSNEYTPMPSFEGLTMLLKPAVLAQIRTLLHARQRQGARYSAQDAIKFLAAEIKGFFLPCRTATTPSS